MGTPQFAVPSLDILVRNGYNVVAVVTAKNNYGGRGGKQLIESPIKKYADNANIPVLQPDKLRSPDFLTTLKSYEADLQIVVAFRMLPELVWDMPKLGTFNLHGSLLPKYRGAAPINHAIIQGETETGVTSFKLKHEIDTGDILLQKSIPIYDDENAGSLHDRMMIVAADVVLATVRLIESRKYSFEKQPESMSTKAPKIFHETCQINFSETATTIYNFIRGLSPYPGAWFTLEGKEIKVLKAEKEYSEDNPTPGELKSDLKKYLKIGCEGGYISLKEIKPEGKKIMSISEFLNGCKYLPADIEM
ncbi:MAG: methionyl-tRNA formyltransferase [Saprospiraceae bacterium]|nr:methionyl-tRNA formyltransferase [Saprospiraceae bacterium]